MKFKEYISEAEEKNLIGLKINGRIVTPETTKEYWDGFFRCKSLSLTSLYGCPKRVVGHFYCQDNKLRTLEGAPEIVNGLFNCSNNPLTSLKGLPKEIGVDLVMGSCTLKSLKGCPATVNGDFICRDNLLTSLEGCPSDVNRDFHCQNNQLTSLKDIHKMIKRVNGDFDLFNNPIRSHVLGLLLIEDLTHINHEGQWAGFLSRHIGKGKAGLLDAQAELIEAGFEEYAQL